MAMETPKSPPPDSPQSPRPPTESADIEMGGPDDAPASIPFEHHPRDHLPEAITKAFPNGNPNAESRTPEQQAALEARKNDCIRSMTLQEMQERYKQVAGEIVEGLEENSRKDEEWKAEKEKLDKNHEMEEKVLKKMLSAMQDD